MKKIDTESKLSFDMTPMIDCTFQLVIFFMLTLNYAQEDQDERIKLPLSELAKPAESAFATSIVLQLTEQNTVVIGSDEVSVHALPPLLARERRAIETSKDRKMADATVIIRADREAQTGRVQELIRISQQTGFERFVFRARQEGG